jgi:alpha-tubulin suppressor-like RCC1 family protein
MAISRYTLIFADSNSLHPLAAADKLTYIWGDGGHGVLGQGGDFGRTIEWTPQSIGALAGRGVQQIACGWAHCAVLMGSCAHAPPHTHTSCSKN